MPEVVPGPYMDHSLSQSRRRHTRSISEASDWVMVSGGSVSRRSSRRRKNVVAGSPNPVRMSSAGPPRWRYHRRSKSTICTASVLCVIVAFHRSVRCADMRRCWRKLCSVAHTGAGPCLQSTYGDHRGSL